MTLEERIAVLEKELDELKNIVLGKQVKKDWRRTVGMSANDPGYAEMVRLGREYREQQREECEN